MLETLERSELWAVQTPQVFRRDGARAGARRAGAEELARATDDAWLIERSGGRVASCRRASRTSRSPRRATCALAELLLAERGRPDPPILLESHAPVLTDCHLHLRPDDPDASAEEYYTAANAERYREAARASGASTSWGSPSTSTASPRRSRSGATRCWQRYAHDDLDAYCACVREQTDLRLGSRLDFMPGARGADRAGCWRAASFDYVVGSVHFLARQALDMDEFSVWERIARAAPEEVWERYFQTVAASARSGLFDIIAHPDLVKFWGDRRVRVPRRATCAATTSRPWKRFADSGVAVEVSTAGLRKPAGELYPAPAFLELCVEAGDPGGAVERRPPSGGRGRRLRAGARAARTAGRERAARFRAVFARWRRVGAGQPSG